MGSHSDSLAVVVPASNRNEAAIDDLRLLGVWLFDFFFFNFPRTHVGVLTDGGQKMGDSMK